MKAHRIFLLVLICNAVLCVPFAHANIASKSYVDAIVAGINQKQANWAQTDSTAPDYIQNKPDIISREELNTELEKKADADDVRFDTIPTEEPQGTPPAGQVFIWFN